MHISEGVLTPGVLAAGGAVAAAGVYAGLRALKPERIPEAAVMASAFFVASLIRIPAGPVSVHLALNGLMGVMLGWAAFPAILVALTLQAVLFQYGGFTTLGVNACVMAWPAIVAYYISKPLMQNPRRAALGGAIAGATGVGLGACLVALALAASGEGLRAVAVYVFAGQVPAIIVEAVVSGFLAGFIRKVKPEMLGVE